MNNEHLIGSLTYSTSDDTILVHNGSSWAGLNVGSHIADISEPIAKSETLEDRMIRLEEKMDKMITMLDLKMSSKDLEILDTLTGDGRGE